GASRAAGIAGGLLSAAGFAGSTLLARWAVPRYGAVRVLFYEIAGGTAILGVVLPLVGEPPVPPGTLPGWIYIASLGLGAVLGANFCYFAAVRRIDAAPTAVAASIEPVVGALLALLLFQQYLTGGGWLGLFLVVGRVAAGYWRPAWSRWWSGRPSSGSSCPAARPRTSRPAWWTARSSACTRGHRRP